LIKSTKCKLYHTKKIKLTADYLIIRITTFKQRIVHITRHVVLLPVMEHAIKKIKKRVTKDVQYIIHAGGLP